MLKAPRALSDLFIGPQTKPELLRDLLSLVEQFARSNFLEREKIIEYRDKALNKESLFESLPNEGTPLPELLADFEARIANGSIAQFSPRYLAFPDCANASPALLAAMLIPLLNQNLIAVDKSAPTGTFVELQVIQWLRSLVGYSDADEPIDSALQAGGISCQGGVAANCLAVMIALHSKYPGLRNTGLRSIEQDPILFVARPTLNHYSHVAAAAWLGLGDAHVRTVAAGPDYRMDISDLEQKLETCIKTKAEFPLAVICQAGDSRTTSFDRFEAISKVCRAYGAWMHVDACHGGSLLFSKKYREKLAGIQCADSVALDPHKGLFCPYPSSYLLLRKREQVGACSRCSDITIVKGSYDLGQISPLTGSRPFDSLKLWFLIRCLGLSALADIVDRRVELTQYWHDLLSSSTYFTPLNDDIDLTNLSFSIRPDFFSSCDPSVRSHALSNCNKRLHDLIYREGIFCIHTFDLVDLKGWFGTERSQTFRALGTSFGNPLTTKQTVHELLAHLEGKVEGMLRTESQEAA